MQHGSVRFSRSRQREVHFLLDAHIPRRLCDSLRRHGHECTHTEALPDGNTSPDGIVASWADERGAVVITKDDDFRISHRLGHPPARLLLISIGNCSNLELTDYIERVLPILETSFEQPATIEIRRDVVVVTRQVIR